jgi:hypothetical protein
MYEMNLFMEQLKKWAKEKQLLKKTIQNFWMFFSEYKSSDEYKIHFGENDCNTLITLGFPSITLVRQINNGFDYCAVTLHIYYCNKSCGYYKDFFTFEGEHYDYELNFK